MIPKLRRPASLVALFTLALAALLPAAAIASEHGAPALDENGKIWVCKYVGQPGEDERLKQGNDGLVVVSPNTLRNVDGADHEDPRVGDSWTDAQERSEVIAPGDSCPGAVTTILEKEWVVVDDENDLFDEDMGVDVTFTVTYDTQEVGVDDGGSFDVGPGTEVTITEDVTGFPHEDCTFVAVGFNDDGTLAHTVGDEDDTVTIVNEVTCPAGNGELPDVTTTLVKDWDVIEDPDGLFDENEVDVTFDVDGETVTEGGSFDAAPGTDVTITETVTGFPEECEFVAVDFENDELAHTVADEDETVEITNEVTCPAPAVEGIVSEQPEGEITDEPAVVQREVTIVEETEVLGVTIEADEDEVEVLGVTEERAAADELPRTGATTTEMLAAAILALLFGTALLLATRRESAAAAGLAPASAPTSGPTAAVWTAHRAPGAPTHGVTLRTARGRGFGPAAPG